MVYHEKSHNFVRTSVDSGLYTSTNKHGQYDKYFGSEHTGPDVTFKLTGEMFKFVMDGVDNPDLHVKVGQAVQIQFSSTDGFHDWVVDEFNARTEKVNTGGSTSVTFVADKAGTYEYYCSVGQHRAMGMKGKLIVE